MGAAGRGSRRREALDALGDGGRRPVAEARLEQRLDLAQRPVGDDEDLGIVGPQPALWKATRSARPKAAIALGSPPGGRAIGMVGAIEHHGSSRRATRCGSFCVCAIAVSSCERMRSMSSGAERRVPDHVAHQVERRREVRRQRVQRHIGAVGAVAGADVRAEPLLVLRDLLRVNLDVPSSSRSMVIAASPRACGASAALPASNASATWVTGTPRAAT